MAMYRKIEININSTAFGREQLSEIINAIHEKINSGSAELWIKNPRWRWWKVWESEWLVPPRSLKDGAHGDC
jgi:hypothetical protein